MREMKDSGVEWIGEIPATWSLTTIKREYSFQTGGTPDTATEEYYEGSNTWVNISDLKCKYVYASERHISDDAIEKTSMLISPKGSLLYAFKLSVGAVAFCGENLYTNEAIATFLPGKNSLPYLYYAAPVFIVMNANENIYGAKILNQKLIKNATIVLPPIEEQCRCATFLDTKCAKIDAVIERQRAAIEKLKAYKLAVITEAVTKGLNPDVEMKDSGIDFIGKIPIDWGTVRLKFLLTDIVDCPHETPNYSTDGDYYVIRTADQELGKLRPDEDMYRLDKAEYINRIRRMPLEKDDIVYGREGERWGLACLVPVSNKYCLGQRMLQFRCDARRFVPEYAVWALNSRCVYFQGSVDTMGSTSPHVNISTLRNVFIPTPSIDEQKEIAAYLNSKCGAIDRGIEKKQAVIDKLTAYKKSLIYEVVTGKKEV